MAGHERCEGLSCSLKPSFTLSSGNSEQGLIPPDDLQTKKGGFYTKGPTLENFFLFNSGCPCCPYNIQISIFWSHCPNTWQQWWCQAINITSFYQVCIYSFPISFLVSRHLPLASQTSWSCCTNTTLQCWEAHIEKTLKKETQQHSLDLFLDFIVFMRTVLYLAWKKDITTKGKLRTPKLTSPESPKPLCMCSKDKV